MKRQIGHGILVPDPSMQSTITASSITSIVSQSSSYTSGGGAGDDAALWSITPNPPNQNGIHVIHNNNNNKNNNISTKNNHNNHTVDKLSRSDDPRTTVELELEQRQQNVGNDKYKVEDDELVVSPRKAAVLDWKRFKKNQKDNNNNMEDSSSASLLLSLADNVTIDLVNEEDDYDYEEEDSTEHAPGATTHGQRWSCCWWW
jgi:hypothetical protein